MANQKKKKKKKKKVTESNTSAFYFVKRRVRAFRNGPIRRARSFAKEFRVVVVDDIAGAAVSSWSALPIYIRRLVYIYTLSLSLYVVVLFKKVFFESGRRLARSGYYTRPFGASRLLFLYLKLLGGRRSRASGRLRPHLATAQRAMQL